ncbi:MAG: YkgJ family cysteine cluster protein [Bryobacteraceae bacterium]|jgi:Fe-S-cluster containining protein
MEPFRFACVPACTSCCRQKGFVYLSEENLRRAAAFLRLSSAAFERKYVYRTKNLLRLRKPRGSQCHFLRERGCAIHPVKPAQCVAFPFWPELVGCRTAWDQAAAYCPGIGCGPPVPVETAHRIAAEMREIYPGVYWPAGTR